MARYAIGDIQGCYTPFLKLLAKIGFNPGIDTLYLVGDLVNRGNESLSVLKWIYANQDNVITTLGNHDIYLLARYNNIRSADADDTLNDVLLYPKAQNLIDFLRSCPLIYEMSDYIIVHAGIYPHIDFNHLTLLNHLITQQLQSTKYATFIDNIYGNKPNTWDNNLSPLQQMKFVINSCTRMRYLDTKDYSLNYNHKSKTKKDNTLIPWFNVNSHKTINKKIIFGHWAALGLHIDTKCIGIDTGCVWGKKLTAINLDTLEVIQVKNKL